MSQVNIEKSPIAIFAYNRLDSLQKTITALQKCRGAAEKELYVFCDGPRQKDIAAVQLVRAYVKTIDGFKQIHFRFSQNNKGLATSIIEGVSEIIKLHGKIIVLEDDLITSTNFLNYMDQALEMYETKPKVLGISGYTVPMQLEGDYPYDNYFTKRASSWGWATWKNRWEPVDWSVSDYETFLKDKQSQRRFNQMGSDMTKMLAQQMRGEISSWAIRWCYHQFKHDLYTVFPTVSKIENIGFGVNATHTSTENDRFATVLDESDQHKFKFHPKPTLNRHLIRQFIATYSLKKRIYYKIKTILGI